MRILGVESTSNAPEKQRRFQIFRRAVIVIQSDCFNSYRSESL
jgi:hypothetical protein